MGPKMVEKVKNADAGLLADLNQVLKKHTVAHHSNISPQANWISSNHKKNRQEFENQDVPSVADSIKGLLTHLVNLEQRVREAEKYGDLQSLDELGAVIRAARVKQGLTIEGLAELADVGQVTVHKLEKGSLQVQVPKLVQVVDALGLELMVTAR